MTELYRDLLQVVELRADLQLMVSTQQDSSHVMGWNVEILELQTAESEIRLRIVELEMRGLNLGSV